MLAEDIALTGGDCDIMEDMVLDLNGHTLSVAEEGYSFSILFRYEKELIIRDSVGGGAIRYG